MPDPLNRLVDGNSRFVEERTAYPRHDLARVRQVAPRQEPFAIVVTCSDSRVPPEIIFDQGVGDLFVVRTAGNVLDDIGIGSIEYAVEHLGTSLIVIMGHKSCGAVKAAVMGGNVPGHIGDVVTALVPAVARARETCKDGNIVDAAVRANIDIVSRSIKLRSAIISHLIDAGRLSIEGAYYDIENGKVEFLT